MPCEFRVTNLVRVVAKQTRDAIDPNEDGFLLAGANGAFDYTFSDSQWGSIPANATSLVAHGVFSQLSVVYIFPR